MGDDVKWCGRLKVETNIARRFSQVINKNRRPAGIEWCRIARKRTHPGMVMVRSWAIIKFAAPVLPNIFPGSIVAECHCPTKPLYKHIRLIAEKEFGRHRIYDGVICVVEIRDNVDVDHFAVYAVVGGGGVIGALSKLQANEPQIVWNLVQRREATGRQRPHQDDAQPSHRRLRHGSRYGSARRTPSSRKTTRLPAPRQPAQRQCGVVRRRTLTCPTSGSSTMPPIRRCSRS